MNSTATTRRNAVCNTCTIQLVHIAYERAPWFRLVRGPLKWTMRGLAWLYRIDPAQYDVRTPACYGCLRFYKTSLKERLALFRWLNERVNPLFDALLERIVSADAVKQAKAYAHAASAGAVGEDSEAAPSKAQALEARGAHGLKS